jgi:hypothetical protein
LPTTPQPVDCNASISPHLTLMQFKLKWAIRKKLYMSAMVVKNHNPQFADFVKKT